MDDLPQLVERAHALAREAGFPLTRVEVLAGDALETLAPRGPFDLLVGTRR